MPRRAQGPRPSQCCKCRKFIGNEPGRSKTCLECQDKRKKDRELPWVKSHLEANADIVLTCRKCGAHEVFENYREPIKDNCAKILTGPKKPDKMGSTIDRLNSHLEVFRKKHHHGAWDKKERKFDLVPANAITYILEAEKRDKKIRKRHWIAREVLDTYHVFVTPAMVGKIWKTRGLDQYRQFKPRASAGARWDK